jgi:hypothetical protein
MDVVDGMRIILATSTAVLPSSLSLRYYAMTTKERRHDQLVDLAVNVWNLSALVVDATGVGAGLASFLADQLERGPRRVTVSPFLLRSCFKTGPGWPDSAP